MTRLAKIVGYAVLTWAAFLVAVEIDWRRHRVGRHSDGDAHER